MKIELNEKEIDMIYEALITEIEEQKEEVAADERRGRGDYSRNYLDEVRVLKMKIEPYTMKVECKKG